MSSFLRMLHSVRRQRSLSSVDQGSDQPPSISNSGAASFSSTGRVEVPAEDSRTAAIAHHTPVNGLEVVDLEKSIAHTGRKVRAMDVDLAAVDAHPAGHVLFGEAKGRASSVLP